MPKWIIAVVALTCVLARPGWSAEWQPIAEEEARIVFYPPGLSGGEFRKRSQSSTNMEWAMWRGFGGMPRAEVSLNMLFPGRHYTREWKLKTITHNWNFFKDKDLQISNTNRTSTKLGSIQYQKFAVEDLICISFLHGWGSREGGDRGDINVSPNYIYGYYCDRSALSEDTVKAVLGGIGVRGHKVPAKPSNLGAVKQKGDLRSANLQGASFRRANLQGFNFEGANLREANLAGAHLQKANFDGAAL